jgi:hypothetical protein
MNATSVKSSSWQAKLMWTAVVVLGAVSFGIVALSRGETVNAAWLVVAAVCVYFVAYRFYGLFVANTSQLASVSPCYSTSDVKRPFLREARSPNRTEHTRYGENTSCIEVRSVRGTLVVLDCGTGAHSLGQHPMSTSAKGLRGHILNQSSLCAVLRPAF